MFIKEYQCEKCEEIQERWLDTSEDENKEKCEKCGAKAKHLKPILSSTTKHGSWGRWTV